MWRVPSGDCKTFQGQNCRNTCGTILPDGTSLQVCCLCLSSSFLHTTLSFLLFLPLFSLPPSLPPSLPGRHISCGYEDGGVRVWSLKECTTVTTVSPNHGAPVTSVAAHSDGVLLMTGSEDSTARLVNSSSGKVCTGRVQKKGEAIGVQCGGERYVRIPPPPPPPPPPLFLLRLWPPLQLACLQGVQTVHHLWRQWLSVPPSLWFSLPLCLEQLACGTLRHKNCGTTCNTQ